MSPQEGPPCGGGRPRHLPSLSEATSSLLVKSKELETEVVRLTWGPRVSVRLTAQSI